MHPDGSAQHSLFALRCPLEGQVQNTAAHEIHNGCFTQVVHLSVTPKQAIIGAAQSAGPASHYGWHLATDTNWATSGT
jgi:hypothetical protein